MEAEPIQITSAHRIPRGSTNIKNTSNDIFKFGGSLDYELGAVARYDRTPVATLEKQRVQQKREHEAARNQNRRNWIAGIEQNRWNKMANEYCRKEQEWLNRHNHTQMGKNSVSYNPINLEYHKNDEGNKLSQDDAKALYRTSMRAAHLYLKNNTFDPLRCQDIPRRLVIDPSETKEFAPTPTVLPASKEGKEGKEGKDSKDSNGDKLDVPRRLALVAAQRAHAVKTKIPEGAEKVFMAEAARVVNAKMGVAAAGTAKSVHAKDSKTPNHGTIIVETDGDGMNQHSWTRHC